MRSRSRSKRTDFTVTPTGTATFGCRSRKAMKLKNGIEILSKEQSIAGVRLRAPFSAPDIRASEKLLEKLKDPAIASQWGLNIAGTNKQDNFNFQKVGDILPKDEDYIFVNFRAISKTIVEGH